MIATEHEIAVALVMSTTPYYNIMESPLIKSCGSYTGGFHDKWDWDKHELDRMVTSDLGQIYLLCKNSWS